MCGKSCLRVNVCAQIIDWRGPRTVVAQVILGRDQSCALEDVLRSVGFVVPRTTTS